MTQRQPKALYFLFLTEMWERFGYFTMVTTFVLYLTSELNMADGRAFLIFGAYSSLAYVTPVIGGMIADRMLGFRWCIVIGAILMGVGYLLLQFPSQPIMFMALGLLAIGNGFFKPNTSAMLGVFYEKDDPKRSSGYTIFYFGINFGALMGGLAGGVVAAEFGYSVAFVMAGVGKFVALLTFLLARRQFGDHGHMPATSPILGDASTRLISIVGLVAGALAVAVVIGFLIDRAAIAGDVLAVAGIAITGYFLFEVFKEDAHNRNRLIVLVVLTAFAVVFWAIYQQSGSSVVLYIERDVDLGMFGLSIPPSDIQSLNPLFILLLAPVFAFVWTRTRQAGIHIPNSLKFVLGLAFLGSAFLVLQLGGIATSSGGRIDLTWMVAFYLLFTMGEMSLSPIGLAMASELAPKRLAGMAMGMWFLSTAGANYIAGLIASIAAVPAGTSPQAERQIYESAFADYGWMCLGAALLLLILVPFLRRLMRA
ncbi:MAG: peptide MFS transporter [Pseudomonadota bacterium]